MSTFTPIQPAEVVWQDGLPFSPLFGDVYYSKENGLAESMHVFIHGNKLPQRWQELREVSAGTLNSFVIGELGFGTGLNFLLAWSLWDQIAPPGASLQYYSCEKHPLSRHDLEQCLRLWPDLSKYAAQLLKNYPVLTPGFHSLSFSQGRVQLIFMLGDAEQSLQQLLLCGESSLERQLRQRHVDAWFLDGFSPAKNPALWDDKLLNTLSQLSTLGTTFSTYSVAGQVKQGMHGAGFEVIKQPGFGQKKEMLAGEWRRFVTLPTKRHTPWHVGLSHRTLKAKKAIVVGAGLAGCAISRALAKRGWQVILLDQSATVGQGASGNHRALLFPNLSAYRAPLTELMLMGFLYAHQFYQRCIKEGTVGQLLGMLQFVDDKKTQNTQQALRQWLSSYPALGHYVNSSEASALAGIPILTEALYIPLAGWIDSPQLCQFLTQDPGIEWIGEVSVDELNHDSRHWQVGEHTADVVVLANGYGVNQFLQTQHLPLRLVQGQMTTIESSQLSESLRIPLCDNVHIVPAFQGKHDVGATFHLNRVVNRCCDADDLKNLSHLNKLPAQFDLTNTVVGQWAGVRAASLDHLPLVGPCPNEEVFMQRFRGLANNSKRWIASAGEFHEGLYVFSGFGSRGLTTIPLCSDYLAGLINQDMPCLPRSLSQAISPARFLIRKIYRSE